jgi:hypothetical protein
VGGGGDLAPQVGDLLLERGHFRTPRLLDGCSAVEHYL